MDGDQRSCSVRSDNEHGMISREQQVTGWHAGGHGIAANPDRVGLQWPPVMPATHMAPAHPDDFPQSAAGYSYKIANPKRLDGNLAGHRGDPRALSKARDVLGDVDQCIHATVHLSGGERLAAVVAGQTERRTASRAGYQQRIAVHQCRGISVIDALQDDRIARGKTFDGIGWHV